MTPQFEQHVDWFVEHLKELGYVKVTLCRDCRHRMHDCTCLRNMKKKADYGYCDEAERKEE